MGEKGKIVIAISGNNPNVFRIYVMTAVTVKYLGAE